ncbi:MAG: DUF192 domain-containing protein [Leptolyngbyaceae cyanobacterium RU_5_1]|nr:DUF192 domain-containing protein [Leptolyngbyaceae cyanobacterium RU_5_1]
MRLFRQTKFPCLSWRRGTLAGGILVLGILIVGCSTSAPALPPPESDSAPSLSASTDQKTMSLGQVLPIAAQVKVADQVIQLEVARTVEQQSLGLMYRTELEANRGMLFLFAPPRPVSFWMKNVVLNLDMVFLRNGHVVAIADSVPPCKTEPCPVYGPSASIDQVIELRGGRAKELGIQVGDRITIQYPKK